MPASNLQRSVKAWPNPVSEGRMITLEGVTAGSVIEVYNQSGMRVLSVIAAGGTENITLNLPKGLYLIRTVNGETKIIIE